MDPLRAIHSLGTRRRFKSGEKDFTKGEHIKWVYIVLSGEVATTGSSSDGRELIFRRVVPSDGFFPVSGVAPDESHHSNCTALRDSELICIPSPLLVQTLRTDPDLCFDFLQLAVKRLRRRTQQLEDAALLPAGNRVCKWLLERAAKDGTISSTFPITLELKDSARMIGMSLAGLSRESISRHLAVFHNTE